MHCVKIDSSHPTKRGKLACIILSALLNVCLFGLLPISASHGEDLDQATLKALYTYKFGKFTQWPDTQLNAVTKNFQYCILGQNPFPQETLDMISGKFIQETRLNIEVFNSGLVPEEVLFTCHIVFISHSEKHRLVTILASLQHAPVLTISDISGFSAQGGMITLIERQGKLRFQINLKVLQQANITISSKIMELAEIINVSQ